MPGRSSEKRPVDPLRWAQIERLFAEALELPKEGRRGFVEASAGNDGVLAAEVCALLDADGVSSPMLDAQQFGRPGEAAEKAASEQRAQAEPEARDLRHTTIADRYALGRLLGEGGMGAVYEARHTGTGRRVAVKVVSPDYVSNKAVLRRFELEARAAGRIESPNVAQVLDVGFDEQLGSPFLAIEFLDGVDLCGLFGKLGPLEPTVALRLVAQACRGLEKAHAEGILHRDVKPANLFLARAEDDVHVVKILDFGIAKLLDDEAANGRSAITRTGVILGSPLYMSPEQAIGEVPLDHRTDLWSLGVVLFEALTGTTPVDSKASITQILIAITTQPVPSVLERAPWLSKSVAAIVDKALQKDREHRYASATEMLLALRAEVGQSLEIHEPELSRFTPRVATSEVDNGKHGPSGTASMRKLGVSGMHAATVELPSAVSEAQANGTTSLPVVASTLETAIPRNRSSLPVVVVVMGALLAALAGAWFLGLFRADGAPQTTESAAAPTMRSTAAPTSTPEMVQGASAAATVSDAPAAPSSSAEALAPAPTTSPTARSHPGATSTAPRVVPSTKEPQHAPTTHPSAIQAPPPEHTNDDPLSRP